ncbi:hypothetical protein IFM89_020420 [Coptis chinensis]|uniref:Uncharacterized protein n=1 Tax=Coptis chinensis TaxID=261450 RepID=A0A835HNE9_9MAGN|nr:hypothetical protein IFM89_020420 [Coptis chinensis]
MGTRNADTNQGDGGSSSAPPADQLRSRAGNTSVVPQRGGEVNLTLGGIDLNNSGSVVVKEDKKLLTVLFPDGRDGRAFTLKAETSEDLYDWKIALENALAQAPSAALVMGQNGIFRNDPSDTVDGGFEQWTERLPVKSLVVGRPILLALEDIDGTPSFLEKALTFIEQHGVRVEGILRQSADVDDVNRRVREYEEGKNEFSSEEDAHLIADCVKHVIRALPSSPVPASCCNALLDACRTERGARLNAMRTAIAETFPEPNRRLLQRVLKMMQIVASHKSKNRMSSSAVAACMAPLLLRPLLAGDCELEHDFSMGGDGSVQLLQAAAAANHAQAIVILLLEEYDNLFGDYTLPEGCISPELYSDSEESGSEEDELTDGEEILDDDEDIDIPHTLEADTEDEDALSGTISDSSGTHGGHYENKVSEDSDSEFGSAEGGEVFDARQMTSTGTQPSSRNGNVKSNGNLQSQCNTSSEVQPSEPLEFFMEDVPASESVASEETDQGLSSFITDSTYKLNEPVPGVRRPAVWARSSARKNLSMESDEDEAEMQKLEVAKINLKNKIEKEENIFIQINENSVLHASLEQRKKALNERRSALEQEVACLQEKLQKERDLRATMEAQLNNPLVQSTISPTIDDKIKVELEEFFQAEEDVVSLKKKVADLHLQLNQQSKINYGSVCGSCGQPQQRENHLVRQKNQEEDIDATSTASLRDSSVYSEDAFSRADSGNVRMEETPSLPKKQLYEKQQMDLSILDGNKSDPATASSSGTVTPSASSNYKKSGSKAEGAIATSSALSKLTTRLNFLKERRTQIVNELQNIESGADSCLLPRRNHR